MDIFFKTAFNPAMQNQALLAFWYIYFQKHFLCKCMNAYRERVNPPPKDEITLCKLFYSLFFTWKNNVMFPYQIQIYITYNNWIIFYWMNVSYILISFMLMNNWIPSILKHNKLNYREHHLCSFSVPLLSLSPPELLQWLHK